MRVDIYRRSEAGHKFSYLVVPEGRSLPEEVTNTDWESADRGKELDEEAVHWDDYGIPKPGAQLSEKGYAITGVTEQPSA